MTHELKQLIQQANLWQISGLKSVLVTVVALNGSSYRRPGVRMLLCENGSSTGAVSGGCVEKEVLRQAQSVFQTNVPKMMTYDGRLRLGCEGILYLMIEPLDISLEFYNEFQQALEERSAFEMESFYLLEVGEHPNIGSQCLLNTKAYLLHQNLSLKHTEDLNCFKQTFPPLFQLYIFGAEHDAVQLSKSASLLGWEITVVADPDEQKTIDYFSGASHFITSDIGGLDLSTLDEETAVIIMTHSFNKDLQYLTKLKNCKLAYLGILGPISRRERLLNLLLEYEPDTPFSFIENIHAPAGINVGAESACEIAISILAEILSVVRQQEVMPLKEKGGKIHG